MVIPLFTKQKGTSYFQFTSVDCGTQDVPSQESGSKDKEGQSCIA